MEEAAALCAPQGGFRVVRIWRMEGLCYEVIPKSRMSMRGCDAASQVVYAILTEERGEDGEKSPGGDLEIVDVGVVGFLAV